MVAAIVLALLQINDRNGAMAASRCRAGLFDCSLPAWPIGAWRDAQQWPALLASLAMLPMMVAWCRAESIAPQSMVLLHFAAMFAPALLLRHAIVHAVLGIAAVAAWSWGLATRDPVSRAAARQ